MFEKTSKSGERPLLYVGIDAGGTKTKVALTDGGGRVVGEGVSGPGNLQAVGEEGLARVVKEAFLRAQRSADARDPSFSPFRVDVAGVVAGVAGAGRPPDLERSDAVLKAAFPQAAVRSYNDAVIALAAGTLGMPGVVVIAGTGSIAGALSKDGVWTRAGGWGYLLGDEGSGFWIGLQTLRGLVRSYDGMGPRSTLRTEVLSHLGLDHIGELVPLLYEGPLPKEKVASLVPLVFEADRRGDPVAARIVTDALVELLMLAVAVTERAVLPRPIPLVTAGGLFAAADFRERFVRMASERLTEVRPLQAGVDAAVGACALALRFAGLLDDLTIRRLTASKYKE